MIDSIPGPRSLFLTAVLVTAHHRRSTMILSDDRAVCRFQHLADPTPNLIIIINKPFC